MADDTRPATAADLVDERGEGHGRRLGVSEIAYSQLSAAAVAHGTRPPVGGDPTWVPIGPRNIGGRITAVAQDSSNPLIVYAGSANGGLWVSRDAGDTWAHVGKPEHNMPIGTLAVVPGDPNTVIVGTGSMTARYVAGNGLFRVSVTANPELSNFVQLAAAPGLGSSPGDANLAAKSLRYTRIRFDPDNKDRFWVASQTGLWRWEPTGTPGFKRDFPIGVNNPNGAPNFATTLAFFTIWPDYCTDLLVARDPRKDATTDAEGSEKPRYLVIYVAVASVGVFRGRFDRKDASIEWDSNQLAVPNANLYPGGNAFTRIRMALCESQPAVLYVVFASNPGPNTALPAPQPNLPEQDHASFVFHSDDSGDTWTQRTRIPRAALYGDPVGGVNDGQADYCLLIEVNPSNPNMLVCGEIDVCLSTDGAQTPWVTILDWQNYDNGDYSQHADQHIAMFDGGDHRKLWIGNDGGLSLARDLQLAPQSDRYWRKRSHGIIAGQFQDVSVHPVPAFNFMCGGGLQDNGSYASVGGATWMHVGWADGGSLAYHATIPDYIFVAQNTAENIAVLEAAPVPASATLTNPILSDLPLADRRQTVRIEGVPVATGQAPFVGLLEQDPTVPGQCLVAWTATATESIAYIVPPPPGPPFPPGGAPGGTAISGFGAVLFNNEEAESLAYSSVIPGPPQRVEGWVGTSFGQLFFSPTASAAASWSFLATPPTPRPVAGAVMHLIARIAVHPADSWIVAVAVVPNTFGFSATTLTALSTNVTVRIVAPIGPASQFTFQVGTGGVSPTTATAPRVALFGTLTVLFFTPGALAVGDSWTVAPDGTVTPAATNTSVGGLAAKIDTGGHVFLTYDRGATWTDVTAPTAPLVRPNPDLSALSPGPIGALAWDSSTPNATRLFAGTLGGVYALPAIPTSTGLTLAAKPANIPLGTTIQLQANLAMTVGGPIDCTSAADWTSSTPAALTVNATGLVTITAGAVVGNSSTITVVRGTFTDNVTIAVALAAAPVAPPAPAAFAPPVVPVAWRPFGKSLPILLITDLTMVPGTSRLRAGTFGRGIWDLDLGAVVPQHRLYIRQTVIEDGHNPRVVPNVVGPPVAPLMDPRLPQSASFAIDFVHGYDIRVDAAPHSFFDDVVDGVEFDEQIGVDDAVPFEDNYVYVQVNSTGMAVTQDVHVFLFATVSPVPAPHGVAPIPVPALGNVSDIYPPADLAKPIAPWVRVGEFPTIIHKVGPAQPVTARFTWSPDDTFAGKDVALLALCTTPNANDALPAAPVDGTSFANFIVAERRASLRIVHVAPRPPAKIYIRDGIADDTRIGGYPVGGRSPDIMVVHPDIDPAQAATVFKDHYSRRLGDTVIGTATNFIYVRVHNRRRFQTTAQVKVFAIELDDDNEPQRDPVNWVELPAGAAFASVPVPPLGVAYARVEFPNATEPNFLHNYHMYLFLAVVKSDDDTDPLPSKDSVDSGDSFWELVQKFADSDNAAARAVPWVG